MSANQLRLNYNDFTRLAPTATTALYGIGGAAFEMGLDPALVELVDLRVSQINGCAFCVHFHLPLARKAGVPAIKLDLLATWRDAGVFSPAEMAALAWAEHLAHLSRDGAPDAAWTELQAHFNEKQMVALCVAIASINAWNRICVGLRFIPAAQA
ncbi:MAG: alkylhydroperoxidase like protein AhpD family [Polaromonas sp.]|nr:alkylhydroperoxidase like protein AhpD family [Polaromonas sp.]